MFSKSTIQHLRIPFSFFLLPVYLFAISIAPEVRLGEAILIFIILHIFLYPASNGYNSYFDRDEKSIGGLKYPPKVENELYYISLIFDGIALSLGMLISWQFTLMLFIYGMVSKAYSHPSIRLKKYAWGGWIAAGIFQGFFTFIMVLVGLGYPLNLLNAKMLLPAGLSTALLWGSYPMTQVYQHDEDGKRGDHTLSILLGIRGTFLFTAFIFSFTNIGFWYFFANYYSVKEAALFQICLTPLLLYFFYWYRKVIQDELNANFDHTMKLNMISALCLNLYFCLLYFLHH
jgi:4-hydroxybenzoate polyprenyltransferase